jgi:hypothetical protein
MGNEELAKSMGQMSSFVLGTRGEVLPVSLYRGCLDVWEPFVTIGSTALEMGEPENRMGLSTSGSHL